MRLNVSFLTVLRPCYILLMPTLGMVTRTWLLALKTFWVMK